MVKTFLRIINVTPSLYDTISFSASEVNAFMDPTNHTDPYLPTGVQGRDSAGVSLVGGTWDM